MKKKDKNKVYFIGAGPGDPKYLTLEGREVLSECSFVFAMRPYPETFAEFLEGKDLADPFEYDFKKIDQEVNRQLKNGSVGFIIPGDMMVFSPFLPLVDWFGERSRVIAGVGILNAAAALLKRTLDMTSVSHCVVLTSPKHIDRDGEKGELARLAALSGTLVLYMNNRPISQLVSELGDRYAPETPVAVIYRIGLPEEKVYRGTVATIADVVGDDDLFGLESGEPSMAIIIIGDVLTSRSDPKFWDRRKKQFWDKRYRVHRV
ncbi:MAG: SAM-dependent methyltransferase [bacterium]